MASVAHDDQRADHHSPNSARRSKSAGAFRTISEVADDLDVAQHVLRFWESKFPQVRPLKRGGGRRYYRPEDVDLLRRIRSLLYEEGYTIKGAQKLLKGQRRTSAGTPERDHGEAQTSLPEEEDQQITSPSQTSYGPLDAQQKQALVTVRTELIELRDRLRKFVA